MSIEAAIASQEKEQRVPERMMEGQEMRDGIEAVLLKRERERMMVGRRGRRAVEIACLNIFGSCCLSLK